MAPVSHAPFAEVTRAEHIESLHFGSVAVVNTQGNLLYYAGDPHFVTFTRSTLKPFQALPLLHAGGAGQFGYGEREIALLCASHSGEAQHVETVQSMLQKAGCSEQHLRCGCHIPLHYATEGKPPPVDVAFNQLHHNCSGKHAGFLAYCMQHGYSLPDYLDPVHPLQRAVRRSVAQAVAMPEQDLVMGIDGCSAPNYALPLSRLAWAYARLAQEQAPDRMLNTVFDAMTHYPELVSGAGRNDLAFMQALPGDCVAKVGAEAVQAIGIRSAGLGIALKVVDGNARALYPATISVLQQLGLLSGNQTAALAKWLQPELRNYAGLKVGDIRVTVRILKNN